MQLIVSHFGCHLCETLYSALTAYNASVRSKHENRMRTT